MKPNNMVLKPGDNEAEYFMLWTVGQVWQPLASGKFKCNCTLVTGFLYQTLLVGAGLRKRLYRSSGALASKSRVSYSVGLSCEIFDRLLKALYYLFSSRRLCCEIPILVLWKHFRTQIGCKRLVYIGEASGTRSS